MTACEYSHDTWSDDYTGRSVWREPTGHVMYGDGRNLIDERSNIANGTSKRNAPVVLSNSVPLYSH